MRVVRVVGTALLLVNVAAAGLSDASRSDLEIRRHCSFSDVRRLKIESGALVATTATGSVLTLRPVDLERAFRRPSAAPLSVVGWCQGAASSPTSAVSPSTEQVAGFPVSAVTVSHGRRLVATFGGGLFRAGADPVAGSPSWISDLATVGRLLVLAHPGGLSLYDGFEVRSIRLPGPPGTNVSALAAQDGVLWAGYFDNGLARLEDGVWVEVDCGDRPRARWINAIHFDGAALWVGSGAGLGRWDEVSARIEPVAGVRGSVQAIRGDQGRLVVTTGSAVWLQSAAGWDSIELPGEALHTAFVHQDVLWAAGMRGVLRRTSGRWQRFSELNGKLPDSWVTALEPVGRRVWVGTYDAGLHSIDGDESASPLANDVWVNPNAVSEWQRRVAVGTMGDGLLLHRRDGARLERISSDHGLPSDDVTALLAVGDTLWVGTRAGLVEIRAMSCWPRCRSQ